MDRLGIFGIRHHGPGSALSLLAALDALDPAVVLIEGPADADGILSFAGSAHMTPPVAILVHAQDDPANATFYPFAVYSPEWQALRWALARSRPVRFVDLPARNRLALRTEDPEPDAEPAKPVSQDSADAAAVAIRGDPIGTLARIAGYEDSEAWWTALVEQGTGAPAIFAAIETAMTELRTHADTQNARTADPLEDKREAHMRLAMAAALKETGGAVAVVCGAWHVPALRRTVPQAEDRAALKGLPAIKTTATWVPWTETRLAAASGYGAGVASPGWYAHLWNMRDRRDGNETRAAHAFTVCWQARVAALLRKNGRPVSTASTIEAVRLALTLAALRGLTLPGLEEMSEASLATLCMGETAPLALLRTELIVGRAVGEIDADVPQMPLAADLARWQKRLKLKPAALDEDVSLDLRSQAGLAKSLLLHRLALIQVPWGQLQGSGSSRGTFRENWRLRWDPEFSVRLAEALVYGTTIEQAAGNGALAAARNAASLADISDVVKGCLLAGLDGAARTAISLLQARASATSDIAALAGAVPPLATILRYGTAREMPAAELRLLVVSLAEAVCAGLVYACRNLQPAEAEALREKLAALNEALTLLDADATAQDWLRALHGLAGDNGSHALLRGFAVRALYDRGALAVDATRLHLSRALSRAVPPPEAGQWLDGFLGQASQLLLHDATLRSIIDDWLASLTEENFTALLPMLRRAFATLDRAERRRLLDELRRQPADADAGIAGEPESESDRAPAFAAALPLLLTILGLDHGHDRKIAGGALAPVAAGARR